MIRPERRNVAVLFADIKGFTSLSETLDPEDLQEIIDTIFREFKNIIEKNGGYLDKFIGDAVMAVFGVPLSKGDDARRAIVTALQMQELLKKINEKKNTDIKLRIGINFGEALWSSIAGEKPTVLGDTVNVSQRVEELAEPGKIYVTASVYEIENKNFYFREVGNFKVRGREEPVKVFEILGEKPNINEFSIRGRFVTPFTGREQEIEKLIKWYSQVRLSEGIFFVDIQGEAGIGKTRFCSELKLLISEKFPDARIFLLKCDPVKQKPYFLVSLLFNELLMTSLGERLSREKIKSFLIESFNISAIEAELLANRVLSFLGTELSFSSPESTSEYLSSLFQLLAIKFGHIIIFIDDAQYIDKESFLFLTDLKGRVHKACVVFILATRDKIPMVHFEEEVYLGGLGEEFIREVCSTLLGVEKDGISQTFISEIAEKTKGNPFFIEELIYFLNSKGLIDYNPVRFKSTEFSIPETVAGVLLSIVDELPESTREVVKTASIFGRNFWKKILERVLGRNIEYDLALLEKEGFIIMQDSSYLREDNEYVFKNELLRETVYSLLTRKERESLHRMVAEELERIPDKDEHLLFLTAYHFEKGANVEKARFFFELAGDKAFNKGYYSYALKAYESLEADPEVNFKIAQCLEGLGEYEKAKEIINSSLPLICEDSTISLKYEVLLASILEKELKFEEAFKFLEKASNSIDPELRAYAIYKKAWVYWRLGNVEKSKEFANESIHTIEKSGLSSREALKTLGACFNLLGNILQTQGEKSSLVYALDYYEKARLLFEEIGENISQAKILINISQIYVSLQDYKSAETYLMDALEVVKKSGSRFLLAVVLNNLGRVYYSSREHIDKAKEYLFEARNLFITLNLPDYRIDTELNLTGILIDTGELKLAREILSSIDLTLIEFNQSRKALYGILKALLAYRDMDFDSSEEFFEESLRIYRNLEIKNRIFQVMSYLSAIKLFKGESDASLSLALESFSYLSEEDMSLPRIVEAIIINAAVLYLHGLDIWDVKHIDLERFTDIVKGLPIEIRLIWLALVINMKGVKKKVYFDVVTAEEVRKLVCLEHYPVFCEENPFSELMGYIESNKALLLKKILESINKA